MTILTEDAQEKLIAVINEAIDHFEVCGKKIHEALEIHKCRQLQMIAADLESISNHIHSLSTVGPLEPWAEIPLENSEINDDRFSL